MTERELYYKVLSKYSREDIEKALLGFLVCLSFSPAHWQAAVNNADKSSMPEEVKFSEVWSDKYLDDIEALEQKAVRSN